MGLSDLEGKGSANGNDGFFEKGLMNALESNYRTGRVYREVKVVANGHSHSTPPFLCTAFSADSSTISSQSLRIVDVSRASGCVSVVGGMYRFTLSRISKF